MGLVERLVVRLRLEAILDCRGRPLAALPASAWPTAAAEARA